MFKKPIEEYSYIPSSNLEGKALFLEETLERMMKYSGFVYRKIKKLPKGSPTTTTDELSKLKSELKETNRGIDEVYEKCNIIWKEISKERN